MTPHAVTVLAFNGSRIDGSLFTSVADFARDTPWLNAPMALTTNLGLGVFAVLMVIGWWRARHRDDAAMALALAAPVSVVAAFAVTEVIKKLVAESRPCRALPHDYFVNSCPAPTDYAFPSGHTTTAAATAAALFLLDRRLGAIAAVCTLLEGFTRVYVGDHYPHDVLGAIVIATPVAMITSLILRELIRPLVSRLRTGGGALQPLLTVGSAVEATR
ncbi:phosphatase PAP2 family protein [Streptomyces sp. NBC_01136]|uniref:phosphatase PAP2 family protein n=1 Tax=unclassified Streptomyces TaxID=2593676 RepID=UPI0032558927|nr:phosphatase PAP2 family protein [Streptomyces sp. NBC_01136]